MTVSSRNSAGKEPVPDLVLAVVPVVGLVGVVGDAGGVGVGVAAAGAGVTLTCRLRCAVTLAGGMPLSVTTATML